MTDFNEGQITRAIINAYHDKLSNQVCGDVIVVGAGPSGLVAAAELGRRGFKVTLLEKRLATGGGIWGGAMAMNEVVVQEGGLSILEENGVDYRSVGNGLYIVNAIELAAALSVAVVRAGAAVLNLIFAEDLCVRVGRVRGVVANRTNLAESLPLDPITFEAKAVIDATGHEAALVQLLRKRGLLDGPAAEASEGPMDAFVGESFVVDKVSEIYPGLWATGMCVVATLGGPRMGPIFGGMLMSGRRVADLIAEALRD